MKNITITDISKKTGYSIKTISRVINDEKGVRESTRNKIRQVIEETGYRPNTYARNLGVKQDKNILISIKKEKGALTTRWINILLDKIIPHFKKFDFSIIIEEYYEKSDINSSLLKKSSNLIDGMILFYEDENDERIKLANKFKVPYVIFGESNTKESVYISNENFLGSKKGTKYLLERGIEDIELILGNKRLTNIERANGAKAAYLENEIDLEKLNVTYSLTSPKDVYEYIMKVYQSKKTPQGIFVSGDEKAVGAIKAINDLGLSIPKDVSILGFDNLPISEFYSPALTTVAQDYEKLAEQTSTKLINIINGVKEGSIKISNKLIIRESVI